jgi:glycosyltransferase involved in cell wall biosynthesis
MYERYALYYLVGALLKRWHHVPLYLEVNSPLAEERARFGGLALFKVARRLERFVWHSADRIFVVSEVLAEMVVASGIPSKRITVIPNGIDRSVFPRSPYRPQPEGPVTIGFIGFMRDWHGLDTVIASLAAEPADPPIRLIIAGDGPARAALESQAAALGVRSLVQFVGVQPRCAVPGLIQQFDIALQPRAVAYASPLKLFEYMAGGRAIVAPDQPNIREILKDGETALLFDPNQPGTLWSAIRRLAGDPALREKIGTAARCELDQRDFTWQGNAARITGAVAADVARRGACANVAFPLDRSGPRGSR